MKQLGFVFHVGNELHCLIKTTFREGVFAKDLLRH